MEIGSFIELQLPKGMEYYNWTDKTARLNTGRSALLYAFRCTGCKAIWIPIYQCDSVRDTFLKNNIDIRFYHIDSKFNPVDLKPNEDEAVMLVNYYGIMSNSRMKELASLYKHPIIDNCQGFFNNPIITNSIFNIYSCRKFIGVPDGAYVIGENAGQFINEYPQGYSSDTATFLLMRIEYGCEGKGYKARAINEHRIDNEGIMKMSLLTRAILDGTDYSLIKRKRRENFQTAHTLLKNINCIDPLIYYDNNTVPMVYPLVVEDDNLIDRLFEVKHFQGHWWSYICDEQPKDCFEYWLSRFVIPITIDQRYGKAEIEYLCDIINRK